IFEDTIVSPIKSVCHSSGKKGEHISEDPFGIYEMLNRNPTHVGKELDLSLSHPLSFTPVEPQQEETNGGDKELPNSADPSVLNNFEVPANESCNGKSDDISSLNFANGDSPTAVHDFVSEEQVVWVDIEGVPLKFWSRETFVKIDNILEKFKVVFRGKVFIARAKELFAWTLIFVEYKETEYISNDEGLQNSVRQPVGSEPVEEGLFNSDEEGNSGGILCIWEASVFKKEFVTVSNNFVAIYGSSSLITRWNGETIVMGDFNVVRSTDERLGSRFNQSSAKVFNQFIESSGLVDIKLAGYSFTWSHPSRKKMGKLDRFLVSEGIVSLFPSISATCLDKHLSDHRPILLHEVNFDFGPSPFHMFHSWFRRDGFDLMVEQAWCSFSHNDGNCLIRFKKKLQALKTIIRRWIKSSFLMGNSASFIALIPKVPDAKYVIDYIPISLIDGPFILNEVLTWCKRKRKQVMIFKVDFAKAYDSVRWDYLMEVLQAFGFGPNWCLFTSLQLNESMTISHLFYADDAIFIEEWSESNMENIVIMLKCFFLASGLKINIQKSHIMGVGVADGLIHQAASLIGCAIMKTPFQYLRVLVGNNSLRCSAWGRLTLLKLVLGASPIYNLSIYKALITVLKEMESIRSNFFKGADNNDRKISWVSWDKVLASKKVGGLGVSSYYALNRALILKWVWRFVSQDGSLWFRVIQALHGTLLESHQVQITSLWSSMLREMHVLVLKGFDLMAHCKKRIGDGNNTSFWRDPWIGDQPLCLMFLRLFVLEKEKEITVASKLGLPLVEVKDIRSSIDSILLPSDAIPT
nr:RNA-directed DNA polymerase, eukaryota [Tanacetum cinerariifolium]